MLTNQRWNYLISLVPLSLSFSFSLSDLVWLALRSEKVSKVRFAHFVAELWTWLARQDEEDLEEELSHTVLMVADRKRYLSALTLLVWNILANFMRFELKLKKATEVGDM